MLLLTVHLLVLQVPTLKVSGWASLELPLFACLALSPPTDSRVVSHVLQVDCSWLNFIHESPKP